MPIPRKIRVTNSIPVVIVADDDCETILKEINLPVYCDMSIKKTKKTYIIEQLNKRNTIDPNIVITTIRPRLCLYLRQIKKGIFYDEVNFNIGNFVKSSNLQIGIRIGDGNNDHSANNKYRRDLYNECKEIWDYMVYDVESDYDEDSEYVDLKTDENPDEDDPDDDRFANALQEAVDNWKEDLQAEKLKNAYADTAPEFSPELRSAMKTIATNFRTINSDLELKICMQAIQTLAKKTNREISSNEVIAAYDAIISNFGRYQTDVSYMEVMDMIQVIAQTMDSKTEITNAIKLIIKDLVQYGNSIADFDYIQVILADLLQ